MTLTVATPFLPAASLNSNFNTSIEVSGGVAPYRFAVISGGLPAGLTMSSDGVFTGLPINVGVASLVIEISDSTTPVNQTLIQTFQLTVLDLIDLSTITVEQEQFVQQLQTSLSKSGVWSTGITAQTSQTLIELISAIGTFVTGKINRVKEDAFRETAQSDSAILSIATMQGLRLARRLPAAAATTMVSPEDIAIPPYTQFSGGGHSWFNTTQISLTANIPMTVILKEGTVTTTLISGLGTDLQTWVSKDNDFSVSDQDVVVSLNGAQLYKTFGGLWNYPQSVSGSSTVQQAYADQTLSDGRLLIMFGSSGYGVIPGVNDVISVTYAVTQGAAINGAVITGSKIRSSSYPTLSAQFVSNPSGGANKKNTVAYKNFAAGAFGTFSSAVTKQQYQATVNAFPGVVDAVTQSQREINPGALKWMNVIRVSALTSSPWLPSQIKEFLAYVEATTMFTGKFVWQEPQAVYVDVDMDIYCFNSVSSTEAVKQLAYAAILKLLSPRPGLLMTNFYESDLTETAKNAAPGQISYVIVNKPTQPMIVASPESPEVSVIIDVTSGSLIPASYSYAVSVAVPAPSPNFMGLLDASTLTYFPNATAAGQYWIVSATAGNLTDPVSLALTSVVAGDQILALGVGNTSDNFTVIGSAVNGVIDVGAPSKWAYPLVTSSGSSVVLDWSATKVANAIQYYVWGRTAGELGVLATLAGSATSFIDYGVFIPAVIPLSAYSSTPIRYNTLGSLKITPKYATRQTNALFPVRDTLS